MKTVKAELAGYAPENLIEDTIEALWTQVLDTHKIGHDEDFFELGGRSVGIIAVVAGISRVFRIPVSPSIVTRGATISAMASAVREILATRSSTGTRA